MFGVKKLLQLLLQVKTLLNLQTIINNKEIEASQKQDAIDKLANLSDRMAKQSAAEELLSTKGFLNSVVTINDDTVDVVVTNQDLSAVSRAQIEDAVYLLNKAYVEQGNNPKFTSGSIMYSGGLRRVYELEQQGVDVFSIKNKNAVIQAYRAKAKLYEILWLYKNYKKAFSL